ncbi:MAG: hypothetical protein EOO73_02435 [Myxococcales bacterium]|nr:MAG: hypothetical protein EOO73_02435 [Myxococcales bacterium]
MLLALWGCGSEPDNAAPAGAGASGQGSGGSVSPAGGSSGSAGSGGAAAGSTAGGTSSAGTSPGGQGSGAGGSTPAPDTKWLNVTSNLPELAGQAAGAEGPGDLTFLSVQPGTSRVIAGIGDAGLFATTDSGKTWSKLGSGSGSAPLRHRPSSIVYDPEDATRFWESGIYGDGIFRTVDDGVTFERLGDISHNDAVSVDFTDPARQLLVAGPHEATQKLFKSTNGGTSWEDIGAKLPAGSSFSTLPFILDTANWLVGSAQGPGTWGVFRTADGGQSFASVSEEGPVGWPLRTTDGALYWVLAGDKGLIASTDEGMTWTKSAAGPVQTFSGGPCETPNGSILALGSTHVLASSDQGKTWQEVGEPLPFPGGNCKTYGFAYAASTKTLFINHNDCSGKLTTDAVWSSGLDYELL